MREKFNIIIMIYKFPPCQFFFKIWPRTYEFLTLHHQIVHTVALCCNLNKFDSKFDSIMCCSSLIYISGMIIYNFAQCLFKPLNASLDNFSHYPIITPFPLRNTAINYFWLGSEFFNTPSYILFMIAICFLFIKQQKFYLLKWMNKTKLFF